MDQEPIVSTEGRLIVRHESEVGMLSTGESSALAEIISRSLVHLQASRALAVPERRAGEEQEFEIAPGVKLVMCWIPPGEFLMGSPEDEMGRRDNETQHRVTLTQGFWLGKYPVTKAEWKAVMGSNPRRFTGTNLPVESVSWNDIAEPGGFMEKVNRSAAAGGIFSLPTEAQWEYACRAGTTTALNSGKKLTPENGACPNLDELAWYRENSENKTHPVGQKKANRWGLHDMHGNVVEWCLDWYYDHTDEAQVDPRGPDSSSASGRVFRGGGWHNYAFNCRVAVRNNSGSPTFSCSNIGFRVARS
jgi:formylglycine-generating enzyme required for sulfatase activity